MEGKIGHTSVEAAQPSGNVQSVGSEPSMITGYSAAVNALRVLWTGPVPLL